MAQRNDTTAGSGCMGLVGFVLLIGLVVLAVVWFVSLVGHALDLTPSYPQFDRHGDGWIAAHYENVTTGYVLTVLTLVAGIPLSVALTIELSRARPRAARAVALGTALVALVGAVVLAPAGARDRPAGTPSGLVEER
jgi:Na+/proline symporter